MFGDRSYMTTMCSSCYMLNVVLTISINTLGSLCGWKIQ